MEREQLDRMAIADVLAQENERRFKSITTMLQWVAECEKEARFDGHIANIVRYA